MRNKMLFCGVAIAGMVLMATGCGKASDTAAQKAAEKAIETALSGEGKKVDVKLGKDGNVSTVTVQGMDKNGQKIDMTLNQSGGKMTIKGTDEKGQKVNVQMNQSGDSVNMTVQGKEGAMKIISGGAAKVPDDFPKDIPLYPDMQVNLGQAMAEQQMYHVEAHTKDPMEKVAAFCKEKITAQGWTEQTSMNQAGDSPMTMLMYRKGERTLSIMLTKDEGGTGINVTTGRQ